MASVIRGSDNFDTGVKVVPTAVGEVGTYALLSIPSNNSSISQGSTYAGSSLRYVGFNPYSTDRYAYGSGVSSAPAGTWRAMGYCGARSDRYSATLFVRIA